VQIEKLSNELLDSCDHFRETMGEVTDNVSLAVALETLWGERIENSSSREACPVFVALAYPGQCSPNSWALDFMSNHAKHICKALCCQGCLGILDGLPSSLQPMSMRLPQRLHMAKRTLGP